jgi:uncharacterized protein YndB with AHSA1/START domain
MGRFIVSGFLATLLVCSQGVWAAEYRDAATPNYFAEPPGVNLELATAIVRSKTGGRVLSANPVSRGTQRGYKVRVLVEDRVVQTWFVDSRGRAISE